MHLHKYFQEVLSGKELLSAMTVTFKIQALLKAQMLLLTKSGKAESKFVFPGTGKLQREKILK